MNLPTNKHFRKVISLLIKAAILILSIYYIFEKLRNVNLTNNIKEIVLKIDSSYLYAALILVFFNWGIEAIKWKYLIRKLEFISFTMALKSILSGVTISIFTPNRVGEFAGRVFHLKNTDKAKATIISLIGSTLQLSVTVLMGFSAFIIYYQQHKNQGIIFNYISSKKLFFLLLGFGVLLISILTIYFNNNSFSKKIKEVIHSFTKKELTDAFFLSLLRYIVFSFQYYLVLLAFGIDIELMNAFLLIAITFFVTSAIPTFALTEITVRGASSVYFFSLVSNDSLSIVSASLLLWIINLAIPALIGGAFISDLKFFND